MRRKTLQPASRICLLMAALVSLSACSSCGGGDNGDDRTEPVDVTILFSSDLLGKIRSCGCTVEDMGGLGRRATYVEEIRAGNEHVIVLDAGDAFSLELSYSQEEADLTWDAFSLMRLDAYTPGEIDFIYGLDYLQDLASRADFDIIAANIVDPASGEPLFGPRFKVIDIEGGISVGITGVLDDTIEFPGYIDTAPFRILPAAETLRRVARDMKNEADFLVLLSHLGLDRSMDLARQVPEFDLVVVGHGKPVIKQLEKVGETVFVAAGGGGQYIGKMSLSLGGDGNMVSSYFSLVPLKEEIKLHDEVRRLFDLYGLDLTEKDRTKRKQ
jgi:2',3'-cyclic-nucleotide 2'-phosphodiesterase (5'-nucleotidase family)